MMLSGRKRPSLFYLLVCSLPLLAILAIGKVLFQFDEEDQAEYRLLLSRSDSSQIVEEGLPKETIQKTPARQGRVGILKDVYYFKEGKQLHMQVMGERADLVLEGTGEGLEMKEELQHVKCVMQEELYYKLPDGRKIKSDDKDPRNGAAAWQAVRVLEADSAVVSYRSNLLIASDAEVSRLISPGHLLTEITTFAKPTMRGKASRIDLSLDNPAKNFKASHLKATFYEE